MTTTNTNDDMTLSIASSKEEQQAKKFKRRLKGIVVSDVNDKTIIINVQRRFKHPIYKKFITQTKKYHAHDGLNTAKVGDQVTIIEARPFSAKKRWELLRTK